MGHRTTTTIITVAALVGVVIVLAAAAPAAAETPPWRPPVPGAVIDSYRPPATPYGAGNRGLDFATTPGEPVVAVADGEVTFAGQVGGTLHVVVLHDGGVRSSLSFLASVGVRVAQRVRAGEVVGRAGSGLHLGARLGDTYLDPAGFLGLSGVSADTGPGRVRLVPDGPEHPLGAQAEAAGLRRLLGGMTAPLAAAVGVLRRAVPVTPGDVVGALAAVRAALGADALPAGLVVLAETERAMAPVGPCTRAGLAVPPRQPGRRRLVLVGGLGSSSTAAAIHHVDTAALGYAATDVTTFSYRGGDVRTTPYGPADTFDGVDAPAARLRQLLDRLAAAEPDVPVDVVAHSMGGLVLRAALALPPALPHAIAAVVTLATPHGGADLAGAAQRLLHGPEGPAWHGVADLVARSGSDLDPSSVSVRQLAPGSALLKRLGSAPAPAVSGPILAVGSRTDLVVPTLRARWAGQRSVTVDVAGPPAGAHAALPGSPAATRELELVLAGAAPTCRSKADRVADALFGLGVEVATLGAGFVLGGAPG